MQKSVAPRPHPHPTRCSTGLGKTPAHIGKICATCGQDEGAHIAGYALAEIGLRCVGVHGIELLQRILCDGELLDRGFCDKFESLLELVV